MAADTVEAVQKAFYDWLSGGSVGAPVFDEVPDNQFPPVVIIDRIDTTYTGTKTEPAEQHSIEIVSVTQGKSKKSLRGIMAKVKNRLHGAAMPITGATIGRPVFDGSDEDTLDDGKTHIGRQRFIVDAEPV